MSATNTAPRQVSSILKRKKNSAPYRGILSKKTGRVFPQRKAALVESYIDLLSKSQLAIFLRLQNLSVAELTPFRTAIKNIASVKGEQGTQEEARLRLTVLSANLLPPVLRALPTLPSASLQSYIQQGGPLAVLTCSNLHPRSLSSFLSVFDKHAKMLNPKPPTATAKASSSKLPSSPSENIIKVDLLTGMIEQREFDPSGIRQIAKLPSLTELQGQIVGLIQSASSGIVRTLEAAAGGQVLQTLEGYKKGLETESTIAGQRTEN